MTRQRISRLKNLPVEIQLWLQNLAVLMRGIHKRKHRQIEQTSRFSSAKLGDWIQIEVQALNLDLFNCLKDSDIFMPDTELIARSILKFF